MDLHLPGLDGASVSRRIIDQHATHDGAGPDYVRRLRRLSVCGPAAGARGNIFKGADQIEFVVAIRPVARGAAVFGAQVADRVWPLRQPATTAARADRADRT